MIPNRPTPSRFSSLIASRSCLFIVFAAAFSITSAHAVPAFPGAEGFGSQTPGGRGGRVIAVTTLAPDGPGSLTEALLTEGPRIIVFHVGGTIHLNRKLTVTSPFITVAGQTAPGGGIQIAGGTLNFHTHDIVLRGLRIRPGDREGHDPSDRDCLQFGSKIQPVFNVVVDHCSLAWSIDESISLWHPDVHDITVQWTLFAEGLMHSLHEKGPHSRAFLIGDHAQNISVHHCLFAHHDFRNPEFKGDTRGEVLNNLIYNWGIAGIDFGAGDVTTLPVFANVIGNYLIPGADSRPTHGIYIRDHGIWALNPASRIYLADNPGGLRAEGDAYLTSKLATPLSNIRIEPAHTAAARILHSAGAGATVPIRDAADQRIIAHILHRKGRIIDSQDEVGGWPDLAHGTVSVDTDLDGMPDTWEIVQGLDPRDPTDSPRDPDGDGYTNVEEYLNSLFPPLPPIDLVLPDNW